MYTIYKITNTANKKVYIGQTRQVVEKRITYHFNYLQKGRHTNEYLQRSYNKYGKEAFVWEVIERNILTAKQATEKEQFYIDKHNSLLEQFGYNMKNAGACGKLLDSVKKKISDTLNKNGLKNKKIVQYIIQTGEIVAEWKSSKDCENNTGIRSANIIQHMNGNIKYTHVEGYGFMRYDCYITNGIKADPTFKKRKTRLIPIKAINLSTGEEVVFASASEAVKYFNLKKHETIHRILRGVRNKWKDYTFKYIEN